MFTNQLSIKMVACFLLLTGAIFAQDSNELKTCLANNSTQVSLSSINLFIQKAKSLGLSDQEISLIFNQATQKKLQDTQLVDYLEQILEQKRLSNEQAGQQKKSYGLYLAVLGGTALAVFLLYKICTSFVPDDCRIVAPGIDARQIRETEENVRQAVLNGGNPVDVLNTFAGRHPGALIQAEWGAHGRGNRMIIRSPNFFSYSPR